MSNSQPWDYFPMLPVFAFTSVEKAKKFVKNKIGLDYSPTDKDGRCTWYEGDEFSGFCIIHLDGENKTSRQKYVMLAHECVHYAQYLAESLGTELDDETEAYAVASAMLACIDQIGEEWFTTPLQPKPKNQKKTD